MRNPFVFMLLTAITCALWFLAGRASAGNLAIEQAVRHSVYPLRGEPWSVARADCRPAGDLYACRLRLVDRTTRPAGRVQVDALVQVVSEAPLAVRFCTVTAPCR